eukprot:1307109-Pyramimonas_sp.AAC.1
MCIRDSHSEAQLCLPSRGWLPTLAARFGIGSSLSLAAWLRISPCFWRSWKRASLRRAVVSTDPFGPCGFLRAVSFDAPRVCSDLLCFPDSVLALLGLLA